MPHAPEVDIEEPYTDGNKIPPLLNEYGISFAPIFKPCIGEKCCFRGASDECELTRHHLHSISEDYEAAGSIARKFRNLSVLTVWLHACRHREHHQRNEIHVPIPSVAVMKKCIDEQKLLRKLIDNHNEIQSHEAMLERGLDTRRSKGSTRRLGILRQRKPELIEGVKTIEVIPAELVTGALIMVAPSHAYNRIRTGHPFAMTGTMAKKEVGRSLDFVQQIWKNELTSRDAQSRTELTAA